MSKFFIFQIRIVLASQNGIWSVDFISQGTYVSDKAESILSCKNRQFVHLLLKTELN